MDTILVNKLNDTRFMKIEHLAIWVRDLNCMKDFYQHYFNAEAGDLYINEKKHFKSYFLSLGGSQQARLELMFQADRKPYEDERGFQHGLAHFAISVGNKMTVDSLTERLRADGYKIVGEPRTTGDGYYESIVLDPEGNRVEITI